MVIGVQSLETQKPRNDEDKIKKKIMKISCNKTQTH